MADTKPRKNAAQHGTRSKYAAGCHCPPCTEANRVYARQLRRHHNRVRYGLEARQRPFTDATETRQHLTWLTQQGIGTRAIANHLGISRSAILRILNGTRTRIRTSTADRILAMGRHRIHNAKPARSFIDAAAALEQINQLLQRGHRQAHLAKALGYKTRALQLPTNGLMTKARAEQIDALYRQLMTASREEARRG